MVFKRKKKEEDVSQEESESIEEEEEESEESEASKEEQSEDKDIESEVQEQEIREVQTPVFLTQADINKMIYQNNVMLRQLISALNPESSENNQEN